MCEDVTNKDFANAGNDDSTQNNPSICNGTGTHEEVVMDSLGTIEENCPAYIEEDDVSNSIAEGYF